VEIRGGGGVLCLKIEHELGGDYGNSPIYNHFWDYFSCLNSGQLAVLMHDYRTQAVGAPAQTRILDP
jgi:hypothetical protein